MSLEIAAKKLAAKGRAGDTELVHMTKREIGGLHALAKVKGGKLTKNPDTGLLEAGFLDSLLPSLAPMAAGVVGGIYGGPWGAAAASAAMSKAMGQSDQSALLSGAGGYFGSGAIGDALGTSGEALAAPAAENTANIADITANGTPVADSANLLQNQEAGTLYDTQAKSWINPETGEAYNPAPDPSASDRFAAFKDQIGGNQGMGKAGMGLMAQAAAVDPKAPEKKRLEQHIRPYTLNIQRNAPNSGDSREARQIQYGFTPGAVQDVSTYAAQGGIMRLAGGGNTGTPDATIMPVPTSGGPTKATGKGHASATGAYDPSQIYGAGNSGTYDPSTIYGPQATPPHHGAPQAAPSAPPLVTNAPSNALASGTNTLGKYSFDPATGQFSISPEWQAQQDAAVQAAAAPAAAPYDPTGAKKGGAIRMAAGGIAALGTYSDGGQLLRGPGDGVSDSIPATIGGHKPARLADGEFVVPARHVSELGNGSTEAGSRKLYAMLDRIQNNRKKSIGKGKGSIDSKTEKLLPA